MKCKHILENQKQNKCHDYYWSHGKNKEGIHCRLMEWKRKRKVCPYDKNIFSKSHKIAKDIKDKKQKILS